MRKICKEMKKEKGRIRISLSVLRAGWSITKALTTPLSTIFGPNQQKRKTD